MTQSNGTVSHVHSWKPCMTSPYVHSAHKRWYDCASSALSLHMWFHVFIFLIHPLLLSTSPPTHFSFSVFLCACMYMTSIWWIKSNALILSQSRPLPHVRIKIRETPSLCVSFRVSGNKTTTGFLSAGLHLPPKTTGLPCFPMWLECISENSSPQYVKHNTKKQLMFQRLTVGMALSSRSHVLS